MMASGFVSQSVLLVTSTEIDIALSAVVDAFPHISMRHGRGKMNEGEKCCIIDFEEKKDKETSL